MPEIKRKIASIRQNRLITASNYSNHIAGVQYRNWERTDQVPEFKDGLEVLEIGCRCLDISFSVIPLKPEFGYIQRLIDAASRSKADKYVKLAEAYATSENLLRNDPDRKCFVQKTFKNACSDLEFLAKESGCQIIAVMTHGREVYHFVDGEHAIAVNNERPILIILAIS